jgi:hypothetical protein
VYTNVVDPFEGAHLIFNIFVVRVPLASTFVVYKGLFACDHLASLVVGWRMGHRPLPLCVILLVTVDGVTG